MASWAEFALTRSFRTRSSRSALAMRCRTSGQLAGSGIVPGHLVSIGIESVADRLSGHVVPRPPAVVELGFAQVHEIDRDRDPVQLLDLAVGRGPVARAFLPVQGARTGYDEQVDVGVRAEVPPGPRAEQDDGVRMRRLTQGPGHSEGFRVGRYRTRFLRRRFHGGNCCLVFLKR